MAEQTEQGYHARVAPQLKSLGFSYLNLKTKCNTKESLIYS